MSLLPQRKKSAEEIAKLRESFGIPGQAPAEEETPAAEPEPISAVVSKPPAETPKAEVVSEPPASKAIVAEKAIPEPHHAPRQVRSLKRSERDPEPAADEPVAVEAPVTVAVQPSKPVRSLRKSERIPVAPVEIQTPPADSALPVHRHNDHELNELRRKAAITMQSPAVHYAMIRAHKALVIPGYLFALGGAVCFYYYELSIGITAGCVAAALLVAGFIFLKKPLSRHHAAFISVIALFVIVFGALHYFPQLRHGT